MVGSDGDTNRTAAPVSVDRIKEGIFPIQSRAISNCTVGDQWSKAKYYLH